MQQRPNKEAKVVKPVVTGKAKIREKTFGEKMSEIFVQSDVKAVKDHVFYDVVIPNLKQAIANGINGAINMLLFGNAKSTSKTSSSSSSYIYTPSYSQYYKRSQGQQNANNSNSQSTFLRSNNGMQRLIFETKQDATEVLTNICDLIQDYQVATVKDLYGFAGLDTDRNHTLDSYGWTSIDDLKTANISMVHENGRIGYLLEMPRPYPID